MVESTFLLGAALSLATAVAYGSVGWRVAQRRVEGPSRLALSLFATWWLTLAAFTVAGALVRLGVAAGVVDLPFYLTWTYLALLGICVALWALLYYLVYLLTGNRRAIVPVTLLYLLVYPLCVYIVSAGHPEGLEVTAWAVKIRFADPLDGSPLALVLLVALLGPPLVAAAGYFRLFFKVDGPVQRYRIGLVSGTMLAWFLSSSLASAAELTKASWWPVASGLIGLVAATLVYFAYQPPAWVRRRWREGGEETALS